MDRNTRNDLIDMHDIVSLQNHPANENQDHMTICGFFDRPEQFAHHAANLRLRIAKYEAKQLSR